MSSRIYRSIKILEGEVHSQLGEYSREDIFSALTSVVFEKSFQRNLQPCHLLTLIEQGRSTGAAFIDFRKAFDSIYHQSMLLKKLPVNQEYAWFENYCIYITESKVLDIKACFPILSP